jgi:integrase
MIKQLTATGVAKMKSGKERLEIRDATSGLLLVVQPSGQKSWAMRFRRPDGRTAKLTLGPVDLDATELTEAPEIGMPLSLASARLLAAQVNRQRAMGRDVIADLTATKQRRRIDKETKAYTYPAAVRQFIDEHSKKNRGWKEQAKVLGLDYSDAVIEPQLVRGSLVDRWRDRTVGDIDGHDIFAVIDESRRHGIPGLKKYNNGLSDARGRSVARALSKMFGWLLQQRKISTNPCLGMFVPPPSPKRDRKLTDDEVRLFWKHAASLGYPFAPLLKLLLLSGCRRDEAAGIQKLELSEASWIVPAARVKNKRDFLVPLSPKAADLLAEASRFAGDSEFIFTTTGKSAVSGFSKIKGRLDRLMREEAGSNFRPWRLHDLRRTVASGMASIKIEPHIIEAVLNHVSGFRSGIAGTYNVYEYEPEKRAALERWANHVNGLIEGRPANVTPIRMGKQ